MHKNGDRESLKIRSEAGAGRNGQALDSSRRRLQRIVRDPELKIRDVSGDMVLPVGQPSMTEPKASHLSPQLVNPAAVVPDEGVQFQCTECDMMVRESDPYCPFCGAIFADGPMASVEEAAEASEPPESPKPREREESIRPEKFDVFGMLNTRGRARELLYQEAMKGFAGSARLLEEIEHQISDVSSLGTDTTRVRRLMSSAWEACREGNWNLVSALAQQTEEAMAPSIPALVRSELAKAREHLMDAKVAGYDASEYLLRMKAAMHCLKSGDHDEALRLTKELMDLLRQDSVSWREGGPPASRKGVRSGY
ncbi:MAG TPA: hypothetical protein HA364_08525 [Thermoplasmata archaeon]|nr:hypothetical protein [Thermoplasmata archaeon]